MIYLASPYSHESRYVMQARYLAVCEATAALLRQRQMVYSPIVHCHELARMFDLPEDFEFWKEYNLHMIKRADTFGILKIEGWKESKGVQGELEFARRQELPIYFFNTSGAVITDADHSDGEPEA